MYRIVKETNKLSGKIVYIIEKRKKWLWMESWTRELNLDIHQVGPIGAHTLDGAKYKLEILKNLREDKVIETEVVL